MNAMWQSTQKQVAKFCTSKRAENGKTHPEKPEKGETGCVLGAGEGCSRCGRVKKPGIRTKVNPKTILHMKKENRQKPRVSAGFLAGAEGLEPSARGFGVDVGTHQRERRRGGVARSPRSSPQRAVLIWCYEESEVEKACRAISFSSPTTISFCLHRATGVGNEITTC